MAAAKQRPKEEGDVEVFTMCITVKGRKVYRPNGRPFHFWAKPRKK